MSLRRDDTWNIREEFSFSSGQQVGTGHLRVSLEERETLHRHVPRLVKTPN